MKILVLSDDFPPDVAGGAGVMAFRTTKEFVRQGHEIRVLSTTAKRERVGMTDSDGIPVRFIFSSYHERWRSFVSIFNPRVLPQVEKVLKEFKPDVVHVHNIHQHISYAPLALAKKYGAKVFMTMHDIMAFYPGTFTDYIDPKNLSIQTTFDYKVTARMMMRNFRWRYNPLRNFFIRMYVRKIDGVIAVSNALKDALTQNNIPVSHVIHNGIDVDSWHATSADIEAFRKSHGVENTPLILWGGRLSGAKGGALIVRAMQIIAQSHPAAKLIVVGRTGEYTERMKKQAEGLGVADRLVFTGWLDEKGSKVAYHASSVVAVPSVCFDSFPTNNLEGFAAHRPVVATCFGGSREIVKDGENGYIVNPFDVENMASKISELLSDTQKAGRFGGAGYELVAKDFTLERMASEYISVFNQ